MREYQNTTMNTEVEMSMEDRKELWLEKLAQLLDRIEQLEKLQEIDKKLVNKNELYELQSIYKLMNMMLMVDQYDMDTTAVRKVRRICKVKKFIPNYILDVNEVERVVSGGMFTELNVWFLPEDLVEEAMKNRWKAILDPVKYGLPGFDEVNYATIQPLGKGYVALSKDNGVFNDYIQYARNFEYVEMEL